MSKRSKARRKAAAANTAIPPGGLEGVKDRAANGRATMQDVDFLTRIRREINGQDGYSGSVHSSGSSNGSSNGNGFSRSNGYSWWDDQRRFEKGRERTISLPIAPKDEGIFCVESNEITKDCPLNPKVPHILVDAKTWDSFLKATEVFKVEWIALLVGREGLDNGQACYIIDDFYFPPQTASGTHVDVPTGVQPKPGTIGAIHSHVDMGVFWSATDKAHSNWPVEIVINRKHEYKALSRFRLRCGEWAKMDAKVFLTGSSLDLQVKDALDAAFKAGDEMDKAAKSGKAIVQVSQAPAQVQVTEQQVEKETEQTSLALTVPSADDGSGLLSQALDEVNETEVDDDPEYDCSNCEGDGVVEVEVGHIQEMIECTACGGTGLNAKGLEMQAALMRLSGGRGEVKAVKSN